MPQQIYLPTSDLLFKKMFSSPENKHILIAFIQDMTGELFQDVTLKETYRIETYKKQLEEKGGRFNFQTKKDRLLGLFFIQLN